MTKHAWFASLGVFFHYCAFITIIQIICVLFNSYYNGFIDALLMKQKQRLMFEK